MYGPTETTIWSAVHQVQAGMPVLIGGPIANTQFYVVDSHLQPVPVGVPGELLIGGEGLARGYWKRPELSAEKFIADPFCTDVESRLYRTGDLVRYRADSTLEFLGRIDQQVKIRGFRIELEEIESVLRSHAGVREAVVVVREEGQKQLAAYVVGAGESGGTSGDLRDYLKQKLPDYMVPAAWVSLPALPLTPNGKVDRKALPAPDTAGPMHPLDFVAPRTAIEEQLTIIWCEALDLDRISIHDNFFELGGHSLLAAQLFAKIRKTFNTNLPLATLFEAPTVEKLSAIIRDEGGSPSTNCLAPIRSQGSRPPLFLVHPAGGNPLCFYKLTLHLGHDQPVYALQASSVTGGRPLTNVEDMAACYVREIRTVQAQGPYHIAGACFGGVVAFEMARLLVAGGQKVNLLALLDSYHGRRSWRMTIEVVKQHVNNLRRRGWRKRGTYVMVRLRNLKSSIHARWLVRQAARCSEFDVSMRNELASAAGLTAFHRYVPQEYPGTAVLFKATDPGDDFYMDPVDFWIPLVKGGLSVRTVPGVHLAMLEEPHVRTLALELRAAIDEVLPRVAVPYRFSPIS